MFQLDHPRKLPRRALFVGFLCACDWCRIGFPDEREARKDSHRLNDLMGVFYQLP